MNLRYVMPASLFGAVLGLAGLSNDWRAAHKLWQLPSWPGEGLALLAVTVWALCLALYVAKWRWRRQAALDEAGHAIQCCFIALIPVSTMLAALAVLPYARPLALLLYGAGLVGALAFSVWRQGLMLRGGRELGTATPILYLPAVAANFVAAIGAGALGWTELAQPLFGIGLFSWLAIESVQLHRLLHAEPLPAALRPTYGVQLAPPAVGLVAYLAATNTPSPLVASMLLGYAVYQVLIAARMLGWLMEGGLSGGFWSFTFGITALALGAERLALQGHAVGAAAAPWLFLLANGVVGAVALRSIWLLAQGKLVPLLPAPTVADQARGN